MRQINPIRFIQRSSIALAFPIFALVCACGGGGTIDTNVRLPSVDRPDIAPSTGAIVIPAEVPFNYPKFMSGQEGKVARGASAAEGKAGATCSAESSADGKAWGAFQLGYAFDHNATGESRCTVHVRLTAKEIADSKSTAADSGLEGPKGTINLSFFMKDSTGLTIKEESLVASTLARGPREAVTTHDFVFDTALLPERGYYLIVGGRVDASTTDGADATVALTVSDISMEVRWGASTATTANVAPRSGS